MYSRNAECLKTIAITPNVTEAAIVNLHLRISHVVVDNTILWKVNLAIFNTSGIVLFLMLVGVAGPYTCVVYLFSIADR